ncbi:hypothetical protein EG328_009659 [Venturia inaequalis]|uniref:Formamidase n=1 Tax=Venturia inaequalis TaxID=5025 RepID=A0A8H3U9A5_VENIN|nr:hypothetical protein EG328_009659 [Venturia inaequalis]
MPREVVYGTGKQEIRTVAKVDLSQPASEQTVLHNRWHPDIPSVSSIKDGEIVKIECVDWTGGQITNSDDADDVKNVDLTKIHYLTGPFDIEGAEPGDVLLVEIQDVQPFQDHLWGFTGIFDKSNGGGFLDEIYPKAAKAIWDFEGVRFAGLIHPGILGCAPSPEVLAEWNRREGELITACSHMDRDVALPPLPQNCHPGSATDAALKEKIGKEGARTVPGRPEHGEGDGEISFCGAIEMPGVITIKFTVMKGGMAELAMKSPIYIPGPCEPQFGPGRYIYFEGFSVDENGKQHYMDTSVAYRQTSLRAIEYLRRYGYDDYQSYLLLGCAPVQGHVAGIVDIPNACTTMGLPVDIFDFDIMPGTKAVKRDMGSCAFASDNPGTRGTS